jgi:thymidylate synthase
MIDEALDWYLSGDMFTSDDMKELEYLVPNIKAQIKALYMRRYMRSNNIMTELDEMVTFDHEDKKIPLMDELKTHAESVSKGLFDYLLEMDKLEHNRLKKVEAIEEKRRLKEEEEERKRQEAEDAANADEGVVDDGEAGDEEGEGEDSGEEAPAVGDDDTPPEDDADTDNEDDDLGI